MRAILFSVGLLQAIKCKNIDTNAAAIKKMLTVVPLRILFNSWITYHFIVYMLDTNMVQMD